MGVGATEGDAGALDAQKRGVQISVRGGEFPGWVTCWPSACDVGDVAAVGAACIDEDYGVVIRGDDGVIGDVVDRVGVVAAGDYGDVGARVAALEAEVVFEICGKGAFVGKAVAHGVGEGAAGHAADVAEDINFRGGFDAAEGVQERFQGFDGGRGFREEGGKGVGMGAAGSIVVVVVVSWGNLGEEA